MGREVRQVPANWQHPRSDRYGDNRYQPMHDRTYSEAVKEWKDGYENWKTDPESDCEFWEWCGNPPDPEYHMPDDCGERTWFQVYETVSEGTPVTPPFATLDELGDYLKANGDFWDQKRGHQPPSAEGVDAFLKGGWAPSAMIGPGGMKTGIDCCSD